MPGSGNIHNIRVLIDFCVTKINVFNFFNRNENIALTVAYIPHQKINENTLIFRKIVYTIYA